MSGDVLSQTHLIREFRQRGKNTTKIPGRKGSTKEVERDLVERMWKKRERVTK